MPGVFIQDDDVVLYVTEECNSNCIMCPMSLDSRKRGRHLRAEEWDDLPECLPKDTKHITITGGEPFLEYQQMIPALHRINAAFPGTEILILTNGRALSVRSVYDETDPTISERMCFAIPIHGPDPETHDSITQSPGSFDQAIKGIRKLKSTNAEIEIRIVGHRLNHGKISETFCMLADSDLRITKINLIAMEMTGCAAANRKELWIDYDELCLEAETGIRYAVHKGINVGLYNFPLCTVPGELWPIAKNSITPSKIRYAPECAECRERQACGGLFQSTFLLNLCKIHPYERKRC